MSILLGKLIASQSYLWAHLLAFMRIQESQSARAFPRIFMVLYRRKIPYLISGVQTTSKKWSVLLPIHLCIR